MMPVITIRDEMGAGAPEIGKQVAERLHVDYLDRQIIASVAERIVWSENAVQAKEEPEGSFLAKISEALKYAYTSGTGIDGAFLPAWQIPLDDNRYLAGLQSVIRELAESNAVVIRGRGSQFILKDYPGALHVLVVAPLEARIPRVMELLQLDEEEAKKRISRLDGSRREFTKKYFHAEIMDPANCDLVINTRQIGYNKATDLIISALP
jgi:hypothetical protein